MKKILLSSGFTLIELLVVISLLALFGTLIVAIFISTLRGSNKSNLVGVIKQNGQAILERMDKTIRDADFVVCQSSDKKSLVTVKNGTYTRYSFIMPTTTANGYIQQDNPQKQTDPGTGKPETDPVFANRICAQNPISTGALILTDANTQTGVSARCLNFATDNLCTSNPIFKINSSSGFNDQVTIGFELSPGISAPQSVAGQINPVSFQTTIQLR